MEIHSIEILTEREKIVASVLQRLAEDAQFRSSFRADAARALSETGIRMPRGFEFPIFENTDKVMYFVMPPDPNVVLEDEALNISAGGKTASSAGSAGTVGSVGSVCGTFSSAGTAVGTAGTAGCKGPSDA